MKAVFVADSPAQAHLVSGLLEESGIRCVVEGEMLFGIRADIGLTPSSLPKVSVRDEDFERARAVLEHREPPPTTPATAEPAVDSVRRGLDVVVIGAWSTAVLLGLAVGALLVLYVVASFSIPMAAVVVLVIVAAACFRRRS